MAGKKQQTMINASECMKCEHCEAEKISKAKIIIHCKEKRRAYMYGQCIPCDSKKVKKNGNTV